MTRHNERHEEEKQKHKKYSKITNIIDLVEYLFEKTQRIQTNTHGDNDITVSIRCLKARLAGAYFVGALARLHKPFIRHAWFYAYLFLEQCARIVLMISFHGSPHGSEIVWRFFLILNIVHSTDETRGLPNLALIFGCRCCEEEKDKGDGCSPGLRHRWLWKIGKPNMNER